ncbi:MAG: hypothetical protein E4H26_02105 [Flavobacteriales bacterium]|nr:MAG: hypothetical protein E4H26_02105 [Flavobacteriales bacterium]
MKKTLAVSIVLGFSHLQAQTDTDVYLLDIYASANGIELGSPKNISNNIGYDNQPSFYNDNIVLFSSNRNGQTDIAKYNIGDSARSWLTDTPEGGEYSPLKIPGKNEVSAIRLDKDGLQRLYRYDFDTGKSTLLLEDLKVGYHVWFNKDILVSAVLIEDRMDLVVSNLKDRTHYTFQRNVGRSLHRIPNTDLISYISKENEDWEIRSLNPISGASQTLCKTIPQREDMCWLINGTILMGNGNILSQFDPKNDKQWKSLKTFGKKNINNITRLRANAISTKLLMVADETAPSLKKQ